MTLRPFAIVLLAAVPFLAGAPATAHETCFGVSVAAVDPTEPLAPRAIRITFVHRDVTGITIRDPGRNAVLYAGKPRVGDVIPLAAGRPPRFAASTREAEGCIVRFEWV